MITKQTYAHTQFNKTVSANLLTVYNVFGAPNHYTHFLNDSEIMHCLIITLDGEGVIQTKSDKKILLKKGSVFFDNITNMVSLKSNEQSWHYLCYWFVPNNVVLPIERAYIIEDLNFSQENQDCDKIIELIKSNQELKIEQANALFTFKVLRFIDLLDVNTSTSNTLFNKILCYISANLTSNLQVKKIAKEFGYCEKHIRYLFEKNLHVSPKKYVNKLRLEEILSLTLTSSYTIFELAELYHFSSANHLILNFKKEYGLTPKQFAKNQTLPT